MGFAIAEAARDSGHPVTLVHGAASTVLPSGVERIAVRSAAEMLTACKQLSRTHPILIMAAAVADYRPAIVSRKKISSGAKDLSLKLTPNPDILAELSGSRKGLRTIGFALETDGSPARAREKMRRKGCDMMVLNNPTKRGSEFGGDTNEVTFIYPDGREEKLPVLSKAEVARELMNRIAGLAPPSRRGGKKT